jgi:purine-binding chemotaxis protein CheW
MIETLSETGSEKVEVNCLRFQIANEQYAIPVEYVTSVIRWSGATQLPNSANHILGLANLRGRTLPVSDLRVKLGIESDVSVEDGYILVCQNEVGPVGLLVDSVSEVAQFELSDSIDKAESLAPGIREIASGITTKGDTLITILDYTKIAGGAA